VKALLAKRAGIEDSSGVVLDHIVSLGLGGHPRKIENLQLQEFAESKRKDRIEVKLQCLVCSGQVTLEDAQREIFEDWEAAYHLYARVKCHRRCV
jgi:cytochrome c-type biogenesis protein CcmH/NrfF